MDKISREQRSKNMAAIPSRGNITTEVEFVKLLKKHKITGWRRHNNRILGTPDFTFSKYKVVIFIDGCFWHGCPKCGNSPKTNKKYWETKIGSNQERDRKVKKQLQRDGWEVFRFWEHELKRNPDHIIKKIVFKMSAARLSQVTKMGQETNE